MAFFIGRKGALSGTVASARKRSKENAVWVFWNRLTHPQYACYRYAQFVKGWLADAGIHEATIRTGLLYGVQRHAWVEAQGMVIDISEGVVYPGEYSRRAER